MASGVLESALSVSYQMTKLAIPGGFVDAKSVLGMADATVKVGCRRDINLALPLLLEAADAGDAQSAHILEIIGVVSENEK